MFDTIKSWFQKSETIEPQVETSAEESVIQIIPANLKLIVRRVSNSRSEGVYEISLSQESVNEIN